ncbi:MAG: hypothetical protein KGZ75_13690 [Syntrophomonadaceae bacterium]|nr:hypothetical protein [Syntrophomonadaceae bacterium]
MELSQRVGNLEVTAGRHHERLEKLEQYQEKQNSNFQKIEAKLDRFTWWLVLTLGGVLTSLILLLVNLSLGR